MKKVLIPIASLFALGLAFIAFAPPILSTSWGKKLALKWWNSSHIEKITIDQLKLSWFGGQEISGLHISDENKSFIFDCTSIKTDASLWTLAVTKKSIGNIKLDTPYFRLEKQWAVSYIKPRPPIQQSGFVPELQWNFPSHSLIPLNGYLEFKNGKVELFSPGLVPVTFEDLSGNISDNAVNLRGITHQAEIQGDFSIDGSLENGQFRFKSVVRNLPVLGIDQAAALFYPNMRGLLVEAIGPSFQLNSEGKIGPNTLELTLSASSSKFNAQLKTHREEDKMGLALPGKLTLTITPGFLQKLSKISPLFKEFPLPNLTLCEVDLTTLSIPIGNHKLDLAHSGLEASFRLIQGPLQMVRGSVSSQNLEKGLNAEIHAKDLVLLSPSISDLLGPAIDADITLKGNIDQALITLAARGKSFDLPNTKFTWNKGLQLDNPFKCKLKNGTLAVQKLYLPSFQELDRIELTADLQATKFFNLDSLNAHLNVITFNTIFLDAESPNLKTKIFASIKDDTLIIQKPVSVEAVLTPQLAKPYLSPNLTLAAPLKVTLQIQPFSLPIEISRLESLKLEGTGSTSSLVLLATNSKKEAKIAPLSVSFKSNGGSSTCEVRNENIEGSCSIEPGFIKGVVQLKNFPTTTLDVFLPPGRSLLTSLGTTINLQASGESHSGKNVVSIKGSSQRVSIDAALVNHDNLWELEYPAKCQFTMDQDFYALIDQTLSGEKSSPFSWEKPSVCKASISNLQFTTDKDTFISSWTINGSAGIDELSIRDRKSGKVFGLEKLNFSLDKPNTSSPCTFNLSAQPLNGSRDGIVQLKGSCNPQINSLSFNGKIQLFPSALLDALTRFSGRTDTPFSNFFGETLNASINADINSLYGPIALNISSPNSRASMVGKLQQGTLTLSEPIYAQLTMTPGLSNYLFKETNPLSITGMTAENPLTLQIDPQGFSLPLNPIDWQKAAIPKIRIELGKIACQNKGNLNLALGLLKSSELSKKELNLWFAPIELQIFKGVVNCERTEILVANTYEIATWGSIDLIKDKVDMILGLTAQCLKKAFGIKNLPQHYVLQVPLKGPLNNVELSTTKATAKIALLLAWQQKSIAGGLAGGPAGAVLGEFLNKLEKIPDFNAKAPPAKRPFPWESGSNSSTKTSKASWQPRKTKKKAIKKKDKPLKQLLKILR